MSALTHGDRSEWCSSSAFSRKQMKLGVKEASGHYKEQNISKPKLLCLEDTDRGDSAPNLISLYSGFGASG